MTGSVDAAITEWVAKHRFGPLNDFFVALGTVEKLGAIWIACALVLGLSARRGLGWTGAVAALTALVTFAADSLSFGIKDLVDRTRPADAHPQIHPLYVVHSSSFPAGHAATAFAGATLLTYFAPRLWPLFVSLALAVSFSRVYVGVHYPTDVLAGAVVGVAVAGCACIASAAWNARCRGRGTQTPMCCGARTTASSRATGNTPATPNSSPRRGRTSPRPSARFP